MPRGHRDRLLAGARQALLEKGYARTTARDIVAASGTNLASIGYHFGSKDALLTAAMIEAIGEWGDEIESILQSAQTADAFAQLELIWNGVVESVARLRPLWLASVDIMSVAEQDPGLRQQLADALEDAREGFAAMLSAATGETDPVRSHAIGALVLAVMEGLVLQHLLDPARAPSGTEMASAIRSLASSSGRKPRPRRGDGARRRS
jgi:AcrR family transcriptional regulator